MPPSYADKIADATSKKELIKYKELIEKSIYLKSKNLDGELLKMIDDKMENMNDNDISDDGRLSELAEAAAEAAEAEAAAEHMAVPPPAKRAKNDETLKILIEKKSHAEYEFYKAKSDYKKYRENRQEIMNKVNDFIIGEEDKKDEAYKANMKGYLISDLVSEIDNNVSLKQTKQCAEIFIITCWIKESYERKNKYKKEYNDAEKELDEYYKKN
jgi:hypothetical protein